MAKAGARYEVETGNIWGYAHRVRAADVLQDLLLDSDAFAGEGSNGSDRYLSEDYMFCQFTRKLGIKTWFCPWMQLGHVGSYVFNGTMGALANLDYAAHGMDTKSRPHLVTKEEEDAVEQEVGLSLIHI